MEYLKLCQRYKILSYGNKEIPKEIIVQDNNIPYYPVSYELSFDGYGNTIHTAILKDIQANSLTRANLERVKMYDEKGSILDNTQE